MRKRRSRRRKSREDRRGTERGVIVIYVDVIRENISCTLKSKVCKTRLADLLEAVLKHTILCCAVYHIPTVRCRQTLSGTL